MYDKFILPTKSYACNSAFGNFWIRFYHGGGGGGVHDVLENVITHPLMNFKSIINCNYWLEEKIKKIIIFYAIALSLPEVIKISDKVSTWQIGSQLFLLCTMD